MAGLDDETEGVDNEAEPDEETIIEGDVSSLNSLAGPGVPRSLRVWGKFGRERAHILIDSGSTHNFIKPDVVQRLGLLITKVRGFRLYIGNIDNLICNCKCT